MCVERVKHFVRLSCTLLYCLSELYTLSSGKIDSCKVFVFQWLAYSTVTRYVGYTWDEITLFSAQSPMRSSDSHFTKVREREQLRIYFGFYQESNKKTVRCKISNPHIVIFVSLMNNIFRLLSEDTCIHIFREILYRTVDFYFCKMYGCYINKEVYCNDKTFFI